VGRGSIVISTASGNVVVDLATADGSLLISPRPGMREFTFTAQVYHQSTGLPLGQEALFYYAY
jgi:hypothetical protein